MELIALLQVQVSQPLPLKVEEEEEIVLLLTEEMVDQAVAVASLMQPVLVVLEQLTKDILAVMVTQVVVLPLEEGVVPAELVQVEHLPHQVLNLDLVAQA